MRRNLVSLGRDKALPYIATHLQYRGELRSFISVQSFDRPTVLRRTAF